MPGTAVDGEPGSPPPPGDDRAFFRRPRGLLTLSGPEVRERLSFLGMQAVLVLYFADTVTNGGMGMSTGTAASASAAYGTPVCLASVAGGRLADRVLGSFRAVLRDGVLIPCGHYAMAVPASGTTWVGLGLISAGTDDDRRDARFALSQGWHWGFWAAAIGMTFGLVQYVTGRRHLAGRRQAALWVRMSHSRLHASHEIAVGVALGGLSFLLMGLGLGDMLLETSGMSATSKLAPAAFAGQTMSLWFLSLADDDASYPAHPVR